MKKALVLVGVWAGLVTSNALALDDANKTLVESRESLYNNIYVYEQGPYKSMTFGYNKTIYTESIFNSEDELDLPVEYTRYMTVALAYTNTQAPKKILEIGFGGGRTAWYLHRSLPNASITSVELDPTVVELARKYFGIKDEPHFQVVNRDGRVFLTSSQDRYDLILIDAYRGPFVPFHLLTKEFYQLVKDHLAEGGIVAQNIEPSTMLFDSSVKTMYEVFSHLDFYPAEGNVVTVAYNGAPQSLDDLKKQAGQRQASLQLRYNIQDMLNNRREFHPEKPGVISPTAKVLTDDFAPVESLKAIEHHNRKW